MAGKHRRKSGEPQDPNTVDQRTKPKFKPLSGDYFPGSVEKVDDELKGQPKHGLSSGKHRREDENE